MIFIINHIHDETNILISSYFTFMIMVNVRMTDIDNNMQEKHAIVAKISWHI